MVKSQLAKEQLTISISLFLLMTIIPWIEIENNSKISGFVGAFVGFIFFIGIINWVLKIYEQFFYSKRMPAMDINLRAMQLAFVGFWILADVFGKYFGFAIFNSALAAGLFLGFFQWFILIKQISLKSIWWVLVTTLAFIIGRYALPWDILPKLNITSESLRYISGGIYGLLIGTGQALVLRRYLELNLFNTSLWVISTIIGVILANGAMISTNLPGFWAYCLSGAVSSSITGYTLIWLLQHREYYFPKFVLIQNLTLSTIIIFGLWYTMVIINHLEILNKTAEEIGFVSESLQQGVLKDTDEYLTNISKYLEDTDRFYSVLFIGDKRDSLSQKYQNIQETYNRKISVLQTTMKNVLRLTIEGELLEAQKIVQTTINKTPNKDSILITMKKFIDRLKYQDFRGAKKNISILSSILPEKLSKGSYIDSLEMQIKFERDANISKHSKIASNVKKLIRWDRLKESSSFRPVLQGKAMIWDYTKGEIEQAYELLDDNLRASSKDELITIFCIISRENILRGHYTVSGQPGYQEKMKIGVVYWPRKRSPGTAIVWGGEPRQTRVVRYSPEYGSSVKIKEWIEILPKKQ